MNFQEILRLHDQQQRIDITYHGMRREATPEVIRHIGTVDHFGIVLYSQLDDRNADRVIREQIEYFTTLGLDFEWKLYAHDTPSDLYEQLIAQDFAPGEREALMVLDIDQAPVSLLQPITLDIRRMTDADRIPGLMKILEQVWDTPHDQLGERLMDDLRHDPDHLSVYAGYVNDQPVCVGWIDFHDNNQFAGLWGGSTLEKYRKRGFYTALLATRLQEAKSRGLRFLAIDASPMSRSIVEKYGFQFLTSTQPFKYHIPKSI